MFIVLQFQEHCSRANSYSFIRTANSFLFVILLLYVCLNRQSLVSWRGERVLRVSILR